MRSFSFFKKRTARAARHHCSSRAPTAARARHTTRRVKEFNRLDATSRLSERSHFSAGSRTLVAIGLIPFIRLRGSATLRLATKGPARHPSSSTLQRLTPRSTGAPTAAHQRPVGGTQYIFTARALAFHRRRPVTSSVRRRMPTNSAASALSGNAPRAQRGTSVFSACGRHRRLRAQRPPSQISVGRGQNPAAPRGRLHQDAAAHIGPAAPLAHRPLWLGILLPHLQRSTSAFMRRHGATPNPSFKPSTNSVSRGPGLRYAVHFRHPGPRATLLVPA